MNRLALLFAVFLLMACNKPEQGTPDHNPDWARGIVWYQIFPERFANGLAANDPRAAEVPGAEKQPGWRPHPWTADWYKIQPWELRQSDRFYDVVFTRRFGGDLIGVIRKLDYLKKLGIKGIYFNPIFEAESLHKYDGASFHHIDDNFGPDPAGDKKSLAEAGETEDPASWIWTSADSTFLELIHEAHQRDIKIVIDGVFNHTGRAFFAFQDIVKHQQNSRYANWYSVIRWDDSRTGENEFDYKGWWGAKSLPEFAEDEQGLLAGPRQYVFHATRRWMDPDGDGDPSDGIDGWRLDVAEEVAQPFWQEWYALVKSINPQAVAVAEIWSDASDWIEKKCFDATMNYLFAYAVADFFIDRERAITGQEMARRLNDIIETYGQHTLGLLWNLVESHDTERLASLIVNPDRDFDRMGSLRDNPDYNPRKPNAVERKIQKQIAAFQMTFAGAPMIYYGTEAGMWGADDPDDRKPMVWPDLKYDDEQSHPLPGKSRPADKNVFDDELFTWYQNIIRMRNGSDILRTGTVRVLNALCRENLLVFQRSLQDEQALIAFNRASSARKVLIPANNIQAAEYIDLVTGITHKTDRDGLKLSVDGRGFFVLVGKKD